GNQVPFIDAEDDGASALMRVAGDGGVQGDEAFAGIHDDEHDIGKADVAPSHDDAEFFRHFFRLAFAADASGVDKDEFRSVPFNRFIDCVTGGAGDGGDDGTLASGESVQESGFADVGAADNGNLDAFGGRLRAGFREVCGDVIEELVEAQPVFG